MKKLDNASMLGLNKPRIVGRASTPLSPSGCEDGIGRASTPGSPHPPRIGRASTPGSPCDSGTPIDEPLRAAKPESSPYHLEHTSSPTSRHYKKLSTTRRKAGKKAERKKEYSPQTPYKEKAKGKEISPDVFNCFSPSCARTRVETPRRTVWQNIHTAVDEAAATFNGTGDDIRIWAAIAWRVGAAHFIDALEQAKSELRYHRRAIPSALRPRIFQSVLNERFPKGGAR